MKTPEFKIHCGECNHPMYPQDSDIPDGVMLVCGNKHCPQVDSPFKLLKGKFTVQRMPVKVA